jgi:peptide/nickel transport system substrate-binding protein
LHPAVGSSIKQKRWEADLRTDRLPGRATTPSIILLNVALLAATPAAAQKRGGTLRLYHNDNPPSTSLLEESTIASVTPFSAVFNNLVVFDPAKVHESLETVVPDLAESWAWDTTNTRLTFKLRQGVKWHDGKPFTARDVQCTWRMLIGKGDVQDFTATRGGSGTRNCRTSPSMAIMRPPSS